MDDGERPGAGTGHDDPESVDAPLSASGHPPPAPGAAGPAEGTGPPEGTGPSEDSGAAGGESDGRDPRRFNEWRKRSATGVVMSGIALGLREALELPDQRPALVVEAPGEPDDPDRPIDLHFDPDDPAATVAVVRHRSGGKAAGPESVA